MTKATPRILGAFAQEVNLELSNLSKWRRRRQLSTEFLCMTEDIGQEIFFCVSF